MEMLKYAKATIAELCRILRGTTRKFRRYSALDSALFSVARNARGQVIAEVLIAGGIFALVSGAILGLVLDSYRATVGGEEDTIAAFLSQEGLDAARAIRDNRWTDLTVGNRGVTRAGGSWAFSGTSDTTGKFTRTIIVEDVNRSSRISDTVTSGGTNYGRTKKVTSQITWTTDDIVRTVDAVAYLTDWNVFDWVQFSCSDFAAGTFINASTTCTAGIPEINLLLKKEWKDLSGTIHFETSSSDFSGGTFASTTLIGSGSPADIELATSTTWASVSSPTVENLNSTFFISSNDGWAVGGSGKILRWNGISWSEFADTGANNFFGLHMVSASDGWAVGSVGKIFRWNGTNWSEFVDIGNQLWKSVFMVSATDGWVVGNGGVIRRWDGTAWNTVTSPTSQNINSVNMVSATDGWAAAASGKILRWNGTSWSEFVDTGLAAWNEIDMVSSADGWVVGNSGTIRRFDGTSWNTVTSTVADDILTVFMVSANDGWAAGVSSKILRWNGTSWIGFIDTGVKPWNSIFMISADDGWVVGNAGFIHQYYTPYFPSGTFLSVVFDSGSSTTTWDNLSWSETLAANTNLTIAVRTGPTPTPDGSWSSFSVQEYSNPLGQSISPPNNRYFQYRATLTTSDQRVTSELHDVTVIYNQVTTEHIYDIVMLSATDGWAVGNSGKIIRFDGTGWSSVSSPSSSNINGIDFVTATDGWMADADGKLHHWDGNSWTEFVDTGTQIWNSVDMVSTNDGWAVGNGGNIRKWNGATWSATTSPTVQNINGVFMVSASDGWAAADSGNILRWNGASWSLFVDTGTESWRKVFMVSSTDGWIVGSSGNIRRWNGTSWSIVTSGTSSDLNDVTMVATDNGWAVGNNGTILNWDGNGWTSFISPTTQVLRGVSMIDPKNGWAGGNNGTILRYKEQFADSGTFISTVLDTDTAVNRFFQSIFWSETLPATTTSITVATRSGSVATPDVSWTVFSSDSGIATGTPVLAPDARYLQYRITFITTDTSTTSQLHDVTITYK